VTIKELFKKDIRRSIKGVVKVEQKEEDTIFQELEEYVVTQEVLGHLQSFYEAYVKSLDGSTDEMGVWISGFFGSGKSHFLKILSYLLENREVKGKKALDFFRDKIKDSLLLANMERAARVPTEIILFNIDSKSDSDSKVKKGAIVKVFMKAFDERQGYCAELAWLADMERQLDGSGQYGAFKSEFERLTGNLWEDEREKNYLLRDPIIASLMVATGNSEESVSAWFDKLENNYSLSIEKFARIISEYCDSRGKHARVLFLVDEMGQYVGDNTDLMLNLQTVTEDLGIHVCGRAWVMVTSQQDIDGLTKNRVKGNDFSKIQGRFATRLSLSSANTDEVIKIRILEKDDAARDYLGMFYAEKQAVLRNLISFSAGTAEMKSYQEKGDFVAGYPFVPYQFNLLQKVFENIRRLGASGKHLSEGERSMLSAFQGAVVQMENQEPGALASFNLFYSTIEQFLDSRIKRTIQHAAANTHLQPYDVEILKVLFMIKNIKEIASDLENLSTLMVSHVDEDKITLRQRIQASLDRLLGQTLIQKNGDAYFFLSDEEQEINRQIKTIEIDEATIAREVGEYIFVNINRDEKNFKYSNYYSFPYNRRVDTVNIGGQKGELTISILTPYADDYFSPPEALKMKTMDGSIALFRLPEDQTFLDEIKEVLRTEKFITRKNSINNPQNIQDIIDAKGKELGGRRERIKSLLETALTEAEVYAFSQRQEVKGGSARERISAALELLVKNEYKKLSYIKNPLTEERQIAQILRSNDLELINLQQDGDEKAALDEIRRHLQVQEERHLKVTVKLLQDRFSRRPYGWNLLDVSGLVALLLIKGEITLHYNDQPMQWDNPKLPPSLCKRDEPDRLVVQNKKRVDASLLMAARDIGRQVFNTHDLPDGEGRLLEALQAQIGSEIEGLAELNKRYSNHNYPGQDIVEDGLALLKEIHETTEPYNFYNLLHTKQVALMDYHDDIAPVKGFFANQVDKYDEGQSFFNYYKQNRNYLKQDTVFQGVQKLEQILEAEEPYALIKDIPFLLKNLRQATTEILDQEKQKIRESIQLDWQQMEPEIKNSETSPALAARVEQGFQELFKLLDEAADFQSAWHLLLRSQNLKRESLKEIDQERARGKREEKATPLSKPGSGSQLPPVVYRTPKQVAMINLNLTKTLLENEADIDQCVEELRQKLKQRLKREGSIRLIF
jgi:G3E family GTPase